MKNKIIKLISCFLIMVMLFTDVYPVFAEENNKTVDEAESFINSIVDYKLKECKASSVQQWINGYLTENAGINAEWYIIGLSQNGTYDFSSYETALLEYLNENEVSSASSRQKYALALIAAGSKNQYIDNTLKDSIGQQGVMSWIFGLHLLNNGYTSKEYTISSIKEKLLSLQLADGGFAIMGTKGDVDVTAMAVQALAPYYKNDSAIKESVDKALTMLSNCQLDSGDYTSYGVGNPESTAQVLVALSSLGIDCLSDSRFIKNGNTLFDGIKNYQLADGTFSHKQGGEYNEHATVQVFYSMISYLRMKDGKEAIYLLDSINLTDNDDTHSEQKKNSSNYKIWVSIVIVIIFCLISMILFICKKRNIKNFIVLFTVTLIAIIFVWITEFQSTDSYYKHTDTAKENVIGTVTLTIRCDTITDKGDNSYIPKDGEILEISKYEIKDNDTVYDVLKKAVKKEKIHIETTGSGDSIYIQGINHIYEFDFGDLSGWMYFVNGDTSSVSCGDYKLSDGDKIEWLYSCEMGKDLD